MLLRYCVKMRWLAARPAAELKAINPDPSVTWTLLSGRYERVIAATYEDDKRARRISDKFGAEMRSIIELMRWTGLRIGTNVRQNADTWKPILSDDSEA